MSWMLIVLVAVTAFSCYIGYKIGFLRVLTTLVVVFVAGILTFVLAPYVVDKLYTETPLYETIESGVEEYVHGELDKRAQQLIDGLTVDNIGNETQNSETDDTSNEAPASTNYLDQLSAQEQENFLEMIGLPDMQKDAIRNSYTLQSIYEDATDTFSHKISTAISSSTVQAIGYLLTYLCVQLVIIMLFSALDLLRRVPLLNTLNKVAGCICGLAYALAIAWLFCTIVTALGGTNFGVEMLGQIENDPILKGIYDNNPITLYILTLG